MMRAARFADTPRIVDLLVEQQMLSRYDGHVAIDVDYAKKFVAQLIQRHEGTTQGGTCTYVIEDADGVVEAFIIGILDRVYHIGDALQAHDVFFVCSERAPARAMFDLFDAYVDWATANPKVFEITPSRSDALPGSERLDKFFERRGFADGGRMFRRSNPAFGREERIAA